MTPAISGAGWTRDSSPQVPNREQWPYDPYPLVVVTAGPEASPRR